MSKQRAIINCERCHNLREKLETEPVIEKNFLDVNSNEARNKALKALEHIQDQDISVNKTENNIFYIGNKETTSRYAEAETALNICLNCDYKQSSIKDFYENLEKIRDKK